MFKKYLSIVLASLCLMVSCLPPSDASTGDVLTSIGRGVLTTSAAAGGAAVGAVAGVSLIYGVVVGFYELGCKLGLFSSGSTSEKVLNKICGVLLWGRAETFDALTPIFVYGVLATITGVAVGGTIAGKATYKALS